MLRCKLLFASNFLGGKYLHNCTLYVTLEPCQMCGGALFWSQISNVVYGASDPERGCISLNNKLHPKTKIKGGILADEASSLLKRFFIEKEILINYYTLSFYLNFLCLEHNQTSFCLSNGSKKIMEILKRTFLTHQSQLTYLKVQFPLLLLLDQEYLNRELRDLKKLELYI